MKAAARVQTKQQLENLVSKLNDHAKRVTRARLFEVGEAAPAGGSAPAAAPASAATSAPAPSAPKGTPTSPSSDTDPSKDDNESEESVRVETIVDQLNSIRGGQSFKETKVMDELTRYFDALEDSEQDALHAYLKGIAQIVSGQVDAGAAEEPKDHGVATKSNGKVTRTIKPSVMRKAIAPASAHVGAPITRKAAPPPKEDTSAPAPIIPKKR